MKRVVVTGGTGYIGSALVRRLVERGDSVTVLTRGAPQAGNPARVSWDPYQLGDWAKALEGADAVVHLAGERAVGVRYTAANKRRIRESRIIPTQQVTSAILAAARPPKVLVSVSGVGYYGDHPASERIDESCPAGSDFLGLLCVEWEAASEAVRELGVRVVNPRMGIVFGPGGGPLEVMARPFKLFVGGKIGSGQQGVSWIHLDDAVAILEACIDDDALSGKLNATSPEPASNEEVSAAIAKALGRPSWLTAPALGLKALFGEGAQPILTGQYAVPGVLLKRGHVFRHPSLLEAVRLGLGRAV